MDVESISPEPFGRWVAPDPATDPATRSDAPDPGSGSPPRGAVALERRAALHRSLGDVHRLAIVDALRLSDRTPSELGTLTGLASNLVAFHLDVLQDAGVVTRSRSEGDGRRRYVRLDHGAVTDLALVGPGPASWSGVVGSSAATDAEVLFVCTANSARSQLAAVLWEAATGRPGRSAGREPADRVHPAAVEVARAHGLDLADRRPVGYDEVVTPPDLVVSVCDRAHEAGVPFDVPVLHWSVADPVGGGTAQVDEAYDELATRISWLAAARGRAA